SNNQRYIIEKRYTAFAELYRDSSKLGAFSNKRGKEFSFPGKTWFHRPKPGQDDIKELRRTAFEAMLTIILHQKSNSEVELLLNEFLEVVPDQVEISPSSSSSTSSSTPPTPKFKSYRTKGHAYNKRKMKKKKRRTPSRTSSLIPLIIFVIALLALAFAHTNHPQVFDAIKTRVEGGMARATDVMMVVYTKLVFRLTSLDSHQDSPPPVPSYLNTLSEYIYPK
ncbi:hypothetical protein TrRE_jg4845, partial [Triparma retinervis]